MGFTQTVYRSDRDDEPNWSLYSYIETGGVKYDLGQIGYGGDEYFKDGNLLTVLSSSRSQPLNITLFCFDISNDMVFAEDLRELLGCWAVG